MAQIIVHDIFIFQKIHFLILKTKGHFYYLKLRKEERRGKWLHLNGNLLTMSRKLVAQILVNWHLISLKQEKIDWEHSWITFYSFKAGISFWLEGNKLIQYQKLKVSMTINIPIPFMQQDI